VAAAELGLPLLDADGMGRAFPEIPVCSMSVRGISATTMALADEKGNLGLIETVDNTWTERLSRTATVEMGGSSIIVLYPMTVEQGTSSVIRGTMSRAVEIGESVRTARERDLDALDALLETTRGRLLFRGKVVDVLRRTVEGFARGTAKVEGLQEYSRSSLELEFQNEHLVAVRDGEPLVTVPDLIAVLDADNRTPITTEGISYGARIEVVGLPCAPIWRSPEALEIVGPDYFGYPFSYSPLGEVEARCA
jgi:DUF917 family protein